MLKVGIYGRMASGKSEVARVFAEAGVPVISADVIGREVVERDKSVLASLVEQFGTSILGAEGNLNRRELGRLAFASEKSREWLDSIVHPHLLKELRRQLEAFGRDGKYDTVVVDAALIVNWAIESEFDVLICVTAPEAAQLERLEVSGFSAEEANSRLNAQLPNKIQADRADYVIDNTGSLTELRKKAFQVYESVTSGRK